MNLIERIKKSIFVVTCVAVFTAYFNAVAKFEHKCKLYLPSAIVAFAVDKKASASGRMIGAFIGMGIGTYMFIYVTVPALITCGTSSTWTSAGTAVTAMGQIVFPIVVIACSLLVMLHEAGVD